MLIDETVSHTSSVKLSRITLILLYPLERENVGGGTDHKCVDVYCDGGDGGRVDG